MLKKIFKKNKGFTLIELLVVIAIIGILSGIVIVSVGDAVARARDSRRLADVRQLAFVLEREFVLGTTPLDVAGCAAGALTTTCSGPGTEIPRVFSLIDDPSRAGVACPPAAAGTIGDICRYSISSEAAVGVAGAVPRINSYRICFHLEVGGGGFGRGMHSIITGSRIRAGC